ncbi:MAG: NADH-quinone oxidoreductase subunit NuoG [Proteobacteria bacterium]|nr:NADH-quinone oxidoreductase subunit NuoG [Pseudomonadota bacterium]
MKIKLEINGKTVSVNGGATIMEAAQQVNAYIPHFCYHEKLSIAANCRMCMVDVEKSPKAVPACATPALDGMVVRTDSERAKKAQHGVMEFLLINHPLDCPICDQGGECQLQDLAVGYGISRSRYQEEKRVVFEKNLGPLISTDMTRCIHCTRCVRFGREVAGIMELGMTGRGEHAEIMPFVERTVNSELSGNMIDICPVGALTSKPFRYSARTWELKNHSSVATHDSWGSHLTIQVKDNLVKRVLPQKSADIHEHWISDRDRFSYEGLTSADRALAPMARTTGGAILQETSWQNAMQMSAQELKAACEKYGPDKVGFFVSPRASSEEALLTNRIAAHLGCHNIDSRLRQYHFAGEEVSGLDINALMQAKTILFIGAEPARELPLLAAHLRQKKKKKKIFSIGAMNIGTQVPLAEQILTTPNEFSHLLERLLTTLGGKTSAECLTLENDLFSNADSNKLPIEKIATKLSADTIICLGDSARAAVNYGVIATLAKQLATHLGCALGSLSDGGNGIGVRRAGALPTPDGMDSAKMLRADLRAIVLLRCEPADFSEQVLAKRALQNADFVCAITTHSSGVNKFVSTLLPAAEFSETDGTYTNGNNETNVVAAAVPPPEKARPGWKILRLLGEYLSVEGFDFNDLSAVRGWLGAQQSAQEAPLPVQQVALPNKQGGTAALPVFCLYGGVPLYNSDILVRRATALQKTNYSKSARIAHLHPEDMQQNGLDEGSTIRICDSEGNEEQTTIAADTLLARGVLRFSPRQLTAVHALTIQAVAEEKTA